MARSVKNSKLDSRTACDKLQPRARPYYTTLIPGKLHIGYRRRGRGKGAQGRWLVRRYMGMDAGGVGRYREEDIGLADDFLDANDKTILDYIQAQKRASDKWGHADNNEQSPNGPLTVKAALERYFEYIKNEGRAPGDAPGRAAKHILPALGSRLVGELDTDELRKWFAGIAPDDADDEIVRRRRSTANRVLTIFRAALNLAFNEQHVNSDNAWRKLKPFRNVDAARPDILTVVEAKRLINASEPGFRKLVQAALSTGARYSELTRLRVKHFNSDSGTLQILRSKSAKARDVFLTDEGIKFFEQLTAAGRDGNELMLLRKEGDAWCGGYQTHPMEDAVKRAKVLRITFHQLRHTYCSLSLMAGMPEMVLAKNLGHKDTRMIHLHYGHLTDKHRKDEIKKGAPTFGFAVDDTVVALAAKGRRGK